MTISSLIVISDVLLSVFCIFFTFVVLLQPRWCSSLQFVRFRTARINIQKPEKPHYERARVIKVCKPIYIDPRQGMSLADVCEKSLEVNLHREKEVSPEFCDTPVKYTESSKCFARIQTAVARGLCLPTRCLAGRHGDAASKHSLCYFSLFSK